MGLSGNQKKYIINEARRLSPEELASDLNIKKQEVLDYLKKRWRPEKY